MRSQPRLQVADLCAGWQADGTLLNNLVDGRPPMLLGPDALSVLDDDDPEAWHTLEPLAGDSTRRARRIDVWRDDLVHVDVFFRDSVMSPEGEGDGGARVHRRHDRRSRDDDRRRLPCRPARPPVARVPAGDRERGAHRRRASARPPARGAHAAGGSDARARTSTTSSAASRTSTGSPGSLRARSMFRVTRRRTCRSVADRRCRSRCGTTAGAAPTTRASTTPGRLARSRRCWMRSSPTAAAASSPSRMSAAVISAISAVSTACAAHTPAKQSACSSSRTDADSGALAVVADPVVGAEQVLHVVAVLVRDHVGLGEAPALCAEPGSQIVVEPEVDVHLPVGRAVEGPDRRVGDPAPGRHLTVEEDGLRRCVPLARRPTSTPAPS